MRLLDRWGAILRLLVFNDERGTISERANEVSAETRELGQRFEAETENARFDIRQRHDDVLAELLATFSRHHHR